MKLHFRAHLSFFKLKAKTLALALDLGFGKICRLFKNNL
jgi:hypothetical protein